MPNMMKYFFDISFSQDKYIYNEFEDKLLFILVNLSPLTIPILPKVSQVYVQRLVLNI